MPETASWASWTPPGGWTDPEPDLGEDGRQAGLLAYDLGRRGFWALEPGQPTQLELAVDDSAGTLIVHQAPLGILGTVELQVAIALAAVWGETERDRVFPFRIADLVERMELSWSGQTVRDLDRALGRLASVLFAATWYDPARAMEHDDRFGLVDSYRLSGRRGGKRVVGEVEWSRWSFARLEARQFAEVDLSTMRSLRSPLSRRLYAYCECRSGTRNYVNGDGVAVETFSRRVDDQFQLTLGSRRDALRKFRFDLRKAAADVSAADSRYQEIRFESGRQSKTVLVVDRLRRVT